MDGVKLLINLKEMEQNLIKIKKHLKDNEIKILAVLKCNAYGHGLKEVAKKLQNQVDYFGVGLLEEGIQLRKYTIKKPILVMGPSNNCEDMVNNNLTMTITSLSQYIEVLGWAKNHQQQIKIHIKIDTGMNRFGLKENEINAFMSIYNDKYTKLEGVFSHFATTYKKNKKKVKEQKEKLDQALMKLEAHFPDLIIHIANSENAIDYKECRYNMVRIGNGLYGPCQTKNNIKLTKVSTLKVPIININNVEKGKYIGYGMDYKAKKNIKIGILPIGFYDGYGINKKNTGINLLKFILCQFKPIFCCMFKSESQIYYKKKRLKLIGKPNMQYTLVELPETLCPNEFEYVEIDISPIYIRESIPRIYGGTI
ncbi:alanine racemase [Natranaerovirga hydrolytica]|uniref:Alanine racemase n=1 Tax=Natranaerovirga hydrolytica TaxID=680378 RepID=A0A4R1N4K9_9FIRM|nr:alanine racemase [Natranaerovirga hydrolytica]TCK97879.1 alanine racemase [Natranaerovirga hydrolytica]